MPTDTHTIINRYSSKKIRKEGREGQTDRQTDQPEGAGENAEAKSICYSCKDSSQLLNSSSRASDTFVGTGTHRYIIIQAHTHTHQNKMNKS